MSELGSFIKRLRDIMRNDAGINGDAQRIEQIVWMLFLRVYDAKEDDWEMDEANYESIIPEECRWRNWAHDDGSGNAMTGDDLLEFVNNKLFPTLKNLIVSPQTPIKATRPIQGGKKLNKHKKVEKKVGMNRREIAGAVGITGPRKKYVLFPQPLSLAFARLFYLS